MSIYFLFSSVAQKVMPIVTCNMNTCKVFVTRKSYIEFGGGRALFKMVKDKKKASRENEREINTVGGIGVGKWKKKIFKETKKLNSVVERGKMESWINE